jgi:hypothetical protein
VLSQRNDDGGFAGAAHTQIANNNDGY